LKPPPSPLKKPRADPFADDGETEELTTETRSPVVDLAQAPETVGSGPTLIESKNEETEDFVPKPVQQTEDPFDEPFVAQPTKVELVETDPFESPSLATPKVEPVVADPFDSPPEPKTVEPVLQKTEDPFAEPFTTPDKVEPVVQKAEDPFVEPFTTPTKVEQVVQKAEDPFAEPFTKVEPVVQKTEDPFAEPFTTPTKVEPVVQKAEDPFVEPFTTPTKVEPVVQKTEDPFAEPFTTPTKVEPVIQKAEDPFAEPVTTPTKVEPVVESDPFANVPSDPFSTPDFDPFANPGTPSKTTVKPVQTTGLFDDFDTPDVPIPKKKKAAAGIFGEDTKEDNPWGF